VEPVLKERVDHFLAKVETDAGQILGSHKPKEHDVCMVMKLPNGGCLNQVFEQMGVPHAPRP
jgi:hypothetical protein